VQIADRYLMTMAIVERELITPNFRAMNPQAQYDALMKAVSEYARLCEDHSRMIANPHRPIDPELSTKLRELYGKICESAWLAICKQLPGA
jgi:hypothetical protein